MTGGVWSETWTSRVCPNCAAMGKPDSRLFHYAVTEGRFALLQARCHVCKFVETVAQSATREALAAAARAHRRARVFVMVALGEAAALATLGLGATALAALR